MSPCRALLLLPGLLLALLCARGMAASEKPSEVLDLHYGEVLFQFYQEDYFTAITHLMADQQQYFRKSANNLLIGYMQIQSLLIRINGCLRLLIAVFYIANDRTYLNKHSVLSRNILKQVKARMLKIIWITVLR